MQLDENTYILGYWFASDGTNNWYLMMTKQDGKWLGQQTFRYHSGNDDPHSGQDKKSVYSMIPKEEMSEDEVIDNLNQLFNFIKLKYNDFSDMFLVRGGVKEFFDIAKTKHYMHFKQVELND